MTIKIKDEQKQQSANGTESLTPDQQVAVIRQKIQSYQAAELDSQLEYEIAMELGDDNAKEAQMERLKRIKKALALLERKLGDTGDDGDAA